MLAIVISFILTYPAVSADTLSLGKHFFDGQFAASKDHILIKNINIFDGTNVLDSDLVS